MRRYPCIRISLRAFSITFPSGSAESLWSSKQEFRDETDSGRVLMVNCRFVFVFVSTRNAMSVLSPENQHAHMKRSSAINVLLLFL